MQRFHQLLFCYSIVALSWLMMMAVHELGHVAGALATGGTVERVVLHPLAISRTDVSPNPQPGVVVWLGPVIGCLLPLVAFAVVPTRLILARKLGQFFAGYCLIANGAYISLGSFGRVGDCGEMLRTGTPLWVMIAFGLIAIGGGVILWHKLGSLGSFMLQPELITDRMAYRASVILAVVLALGFSFG